MALKSTFRANLTLNFPMEEVTVKLFSEFNFLSLVPLIDQYYKVDSIDDRFE
jgi:hypothetical protein